MRRVLAEAAVTAIVLGLATADTDDLWRLVARTCQATAELVGRVGIYAEARAAVLTSEAA